MLGLEREAWTRTGKRIAVAAETTACTHFFAPVLEGLYVTFHVHDERRRMREFRNLNKFKATPRRRSLDSTYHVYLSFVNPDILVIVCLCRARRLARSAGRPKYLIT